MSLWNSFKSIDHHKGRLLFRDFSDIVVIFTVFLLFGNIMLITSVFGKVVPSIQIPKGQYRDHLVGHFTTDLPVF